MPVRTLPTTPRSTPLTVRKITSTAAPGDPARATSLPAAPAVSAASMSLRPAASATSAPATATNKPAEMPIETELSAEEVDKKAKDQVSGDLAAGMDWTKTVLPDGALSRLDSPEVKAYLSTLKERTIGMTPEERLAQTEQGIAVGDGELAMNLRRAGQIAGNAGVRGGAAAGLQADALNNSMAQQAALRRQLVLDNIAQKNQAFTAYGNNLMGVEQHNGGQTDKEKLGRVSLGTQYGGMIDSGRTGIKAEATSKDSTELAKEYLKNLPGSDATTKGANPAYDSTDPNSIAGAYVSLYGGKASRNGKALEGDEVLSIPSIKFKIDNNIKSDARVPENLMPAYMKTWEEDAKLGYTTATMSGIGGDTVPKPQGQTIICTEALHQGAFDRSLYPTAHASKNILGYSTMRAYHTWGRHVVRAMRNSNMLTRCLAWFLPDTVLAIHGRSHRLRGDIGYFVFRSLNNLVKLTRRTVSTTRTV